MRYKSVHVEDVMGKQVSGILIERELIEACLGVLQREIVRNEEKLESNPLDATAKTDLGYIGGLFDSINMELKMSERYANVDEMIEMLKELSSRGYGDYTIYCNEEYILAKKGESPVIHDPSQTVSFGGYL